MSDDMTIDIVSDFEFLNKLDKPLSLPLGLSDGFDKVYAALELLKNDLSGAYSRHELSTKDIIMYEDSLHDILAEIKGCLIFLR